METQTAGKPKEIVITREFDAPRERVWAAWTEPGLIKRWWGPEGFTAPSVKIDLRVGGKYVYAMQGPPGSEWDKVAYSGGVFKEIVPTEKLVVTDYFSDENGNMISPADSGQDPSFPAEQTITIKFEDAGKGKTRLTVTYPKPETEAQFQAMLKSGMTEGWNSSLNKLAEVLR